MNPASRPLSDPKIFVSIILRRYLGQPFRFSNWNFLCTLLVVHSFDISLHSHHIRYFVLMVIVESRTRGQRSGRDRWPTYFIPNTDVNILASDRVTGILRKHGVEPQYHRRLLEVIYYFLEIFLNILIYALWGGCASWSIRRHTHAEVDPRDHHRENGNSYRGGGKSSIKLL